MRIQRQARTRVTAGPIAKRETDARRVRSLVNGESRFICAFLTECPPLHERIRHNAHQLDADLG